MSNLEKKEALTHGPSEICGGPWIVPKEQSGCRRLPFHQGDAGAAQHPAETRATEDTASCDPTLPIGSSGGALFEAAQGGNKAEGTVKETTPTAK